MDGFDEFVDGVVKVAKFIKSLFDWWTKNAWADDNLCLIDEQKMLGQRKVFDIK